MGNFLGIRPLIQKYRTSHLLFTKTRLLLRPTTNYSPLQWIFAVNPKNSRIKLQLSVFDGAEDSSYARHLLGTVHVRVRKPGLRFRYESRKCHVSHRYFCKQDGNLFFAGTVYIHSLCATAMEYQYDSDIGGCIYGIRNATVLTFINAAAENTVRKNHDRRWWSVREIAIDTSP